MACCQPNSTTDTHHATDADLHHPDATAALSATSRPQHRLPQSADSFSLADLIRVVPGVLDNLCPDSLASLLATSSAHRAQVHGHVRHIVIFDDQDVPPLISASWPRLVDWKLSNSSSLYRRPDPSLSSRTHRLDSAAMATLLKGNFEQLQTLSIRLSTSNGVTTMAVSSHKRWRSFLKFELDVGLAAAAIESLTATNWPLLKKLDLSSNKLGTRAISTLVAIPCPNLQELNLFRTSLDATAVAQLGQGKWPKLRHLNLAGSEVNAESLKQLTQASWPSLEKVFLSRSSGNVNAAAILQLTQAGWNNLKSLDLSHNGLGSAAMLQLSAGKWNKLQRLKLQEAATSKDAISSLVHGSWPNLMHIDLAGNILCDPALKVLMERQWPSLTFLGLST